MQNFCDQMKQHLKQRDHLLVISSEGGWNWWPALLQRYHQCWKVCAGFRATQAPKQTLRAEPKCLQTFRQLKTFGGNETGCTAQQPERCTHDTVVVKD